MNRMLVFAIATALAIALLPQGSLTAEAAARKGKSISGKSGAETGRGSDISPWTVTHAPSTRYHKAPKGKALCAR